MHDFDHPSAFGAQHPWHDPFAPQDLFNPRPDQDLAIAGSFAPRPEEFPFTDQGRRDYYDAVRAAGQQQTMLQQQQVQMQAAYAASVHNEEQARIAAEHRVRVNLLLLMP
jgi:hypothetical protein